MFFVFKRKNAALVLGCLTLFCALALNFNKTYDTKTSETVSVEGKDEPNLGEAVLVSGDVSEMDIIKNEREVMRSKMCTLLTENIDNPNISEETKRNYENKLLITADNMDREIKCESLLALKGYKNTVVFISDDVITVSVECESMDNTDIAKINDVIFSQTGNNNIKIVEVE